MCGRISTANLLPGDISELFHVSSVPTFLQSYNVAPTLHIPAIREQNHIRSLVNFRWGLIPHWAKDMKIGYKMINARGETLDQKPSFRPALKKRRCLIAADGFYEWKHSGKTKQPFYVQLKKGGVFGFAGL